MLTLFAIPKPFRGHVGVIQRNAIASWRKMCPACEIILLGSDEGTAEMASELGLRHVPDIATNKYGTPLVSDIFHKAQQLASNNILAYVNADIMLTSDFVQAVEEVGDASERFLMIGQRWDIDIEQSWEFDSPNWESSLRNLVMEQGRIHAKTGIDYFAFSRGLYDAIPPFAIGRTMWDNWLVHWARQRSVDVIDATERVLAVHQNHGYGGFASKEVMFAGEEALLNQKLRGSAQYGNINDSSHLLLQDGLHSAWTVKRMLRNPRIVAARYPILHALARILDRFLLRPSRPLRSVLGLTGTTWKTRKQ